MGHRAGDRDPRVGPDLLAELLLPLWVREAVGFFQFSELCVGGVVWCSLGSRWVTACARMSAIAVCLQGIPCAIDTTFTIARPRRCYTSLTALALRFATQAGGWGVGW